MIIIKKKKNILSYSQSESGRFTSELFSAC